MSIQNELQEIRELVNQLGEDNVADVLDYLRWILAEEDALTSEEMEEVRLGTDEIRRGDSISLEEYLLQRRTRA